jgi:hypothetical protein
MCNTIDPQLVSPEIVSVKKCEILLSVKVYVGQCQLRGILNSLDKACALIV